MNWPESYSNFYNFIGDNDHLVDSGDIGYGPSYPHHSPDPMDMDADFIHPTMPINIHRYHHAPSSDASDVRDTLYRPPPGSTTHRQQPSQQLYIDTQLNPHMVNDSESSTASSASIPTLLITPSVQAYPGLQPSIQTSSPQGFIEKGKLTLGFDMISPLPSSPASPMSYYSPSGGDNMFDPPIYPLVIEHDVVTRVPLPHIIEWKRVIGLSGTNDFVPQAVYQPFTEADRKRYIRDVVLQDTIFFQSNDSSELGISLDDALKQKLKFLKDKDDRMFVGCGPSVSIRVQWPGYPPWSKQIPTMDFRNPKGNVTRSKLAKNIATCIRRFTEYVQDKPMEPESDRRWKIGERHIKVEDLILVSLHHVSKGSWQPQLRLRSSPSSSHQWDESLTSISPLR